MSTSAYHTSLRRQIDSQQHISNNDIPAAAAGSGSESPEPSWCSSSFEGEPQQLIENSIGFIDVAWLEELRNIGGCGQLPRATWTIEPAAEGVTSTQIWMSPPDLGQAIVSPLHSTTDSIFRIEGILVNQTALMDVSDETEIGVLIRVPREQLSNVNFAYHSPLRLNIAPGITALQMLSVTGGYDYPGFDNYTCHTDIGHIEYLDRAGLGAAVTADLSASTDEIAVLVRGDGVELNLKLPEDGYPLNSMTLSGVNSRYNIKGNVNCTTFYGGSSCSFYGGTADSCKEGCNSELVLEGDIVGDVNTFTRVLTYRDETVQPNAIAKVSAPGGCDHFVPNSDSTDLTKFECTDGSTANFNVTTPELQPLPCTMQIKDMTLADVVECPKQTKNSFSDKYICECFVPTAETCPDEPSPASFGALLSKTVSFSLSGMLCYLLAVMAF